MLMYIEFYKIQPRLALDQASEGYLVMIELAIRATCRGARLLYLPH